MPILKDFRESKEIILPVSGGKVVVYATLLVGDLDGVSETGTPYEQSMKWLPRLIKAWDFTDEKNEPMPINEQSLKLLPASDCEFLANEITEFAKSVKKN